MIWYFKNIMMKQQLQFTQAVTHHCQYTCHPSQATMMPQLFMSVYTHICMLQRSCKLHLFIAGSII